MIRIAIVEDHRLIAGMLGRFVDTLEDMELAGVAHDGEEGVRLCRNKKPGVVLMDLTMPVMDGITATRKVRDLLPETSVLILTAHADDEHVFEGVRAGAAGYLHKHCDPDELADAIRAVHSGKTIMSPDIAKRTLNTLNRRGEKGFELTGREVEVIRAVAQGKNSKQIATTLYISERTVHNHVANIYKKLHVSDRTQAVLYAIRRGIIDPYSV